MKVERVSYDVITPSAATGILEAIYWKPAIRWHIKKIQVLKPVRFQSLRTNEVKDTASAAKAATAHAAGNLDGLRIETSKHLQRTQRTSLLLVDVDYVIEAFFTETGKEPANPMKHEAMFKRRAEGGQCFHQPSLGMRQFPASFELLSETSETPPPIGESRDLGFMLHHIDHECSPKRPAFFRAIMNDGVIDVPRYDASEVVK
jgi:CRISPR-associated protein Cas5d